MSEPLISRGFRGRRGSGATSARLPPGQHLVTDFPVLSAGPTPVPDLATWRFTLEDGPSPLALWSWAEFNALPEAAGLSEPPGAFVLAHCDGGYTTNVPSEDLVDGKAMIATTFDGEPLDPEHGGPARLLVPHLYFWKSAKWVRRLQFIDEDQPGFWEVLGYHNYGDPWREQRYDGD